MKSEQPSSGEFEKYKQRQEWARNTAKELGVGLDDPDSPEHFVIPIYNEAGKETQRVFLPLLSEITLKRTAGEEKAKQVPIKTAVEAIKKYPHDTLEEAVKKLNEGG